MNNNHAPAGWFADPEQPGQLRYWDGSQWTEHRAPAPAAAPPVAVPGPAPVAAAASDGTPNRGRRGTWWQWGLGVLAVLMVIGALSDDETADTEPASRDVVAQDAPADSDDTVVEADEEAEPADDEVVEEVAPAEEKKAEPKPKPAPKPKPVGPKVPALQKTFLNAVTTAQDAAENADNDLQLGAALSTRNKTICSAVGRGSVRGWVGEVSELDANGEGKGILEIELADDVHVGTWNNFLSDIGDETLIEPGPLFDKIIALEEGQQVRFSGQLVDEMGGDPCINDSRMTLYGKVSDPAFIFRFSDVRAIG